MTDLEKVEQFLKTGAFPENGRGVCTLTLTITEDAENLAMQCTVAGEKELSEVGRHLLKTFLQPYAALQAAVEHMKNTAPRA